MVSDGTRFPEGTGLSAQVRRLTRTVADFPAPGVRFADLGPVFADGPTFAGIIAELADGVSCDVVAGVDARGFLLGGALALRLGVGVLVVRKAGKLAPPVDSQSYDLEYGRATLEITAVGDGLRGRRVLVVDDVLATGGTVAATVDLLRRRGAEVVGVAVVQEIPGLGGRDRLADIPLRCVVAGDRV